MLRGGIEAQQLGVYTMVKRYKYPFILPKLNKNPSPSNYNSLCFFHCPFQLLFLSSREEPTLYIYDINKTSDISQSAKVGNGTLLQEYIETAKVPERWDCLGYAL